MDKDKVAAVALTALGVIALITTIGLGAFAFKNFLAGETLKGACDAGMALATLALGGSGLVEGVESIKEEF